MVRYLLLHTPAWEPGSVRPALEGAQIEMRETRLPRDLAVDERPTVFVLDSESRSVFPLDVLRAFVDAGGGIVALGRNGEADVPPEIPAELLSGFVRQPTGQRQLLVAVRAGYREAAARMETARARAEAASRSREIGELTRIGVALGTERDVKTLLDLILTQSRRITSSDAGSLYLVELSEQGQRRLRFRLAQTYSKPEAPFDERYGYRTKSMLVIPMKDHRDEVIGVLQLINRKRNFETVLATPADVEQQVVPFSKRTVELVTALAGQAAVAIENSQLYARIEQMFEGFVKAAVHAIEQRDPTTFGHSGRVANMTIGLGEVVDRAGDGEYRAVRFSREQLREIRYAGLLHDFGKVGVREEVLVKAKKLYPLQLDLIRQRHDFVRRTVERDFWRKRAEFLEAHGRTGYEKHLRTLEEEHDRELEALDRFLGAVAQANEPTVLPALRFEELSALARRTYEDSAGKTRSYLTEEEMRYLTIPKGSLDETERLEIESHVTHTYRFLQQIPWTRELQQIPIIAYGHHEKLDGAGYPRHVTGDAIPIQTRMMTISDIYDALTAADRPYKPAVAPARALDIMAEEVQGGQLDRELYRLFVDAKVYEANT